jgi:hypothetical protein
MADYKEIIDEEAMPKATPNATPNATPKATPKAMQATFFCLFLFWMIGLYIGLFFIGPYQSYIKCDDCPRYYIEQRTMCHYEKDDQIIIKRNCYKEFPFFWVGCCFSTLTALPWFYYVFI